MAVRGRRREAREEFDVVLQDTPGQTVPALADFRVVRLIGEGNHGRFYLARPPARLGISDEYVAVKVFAGQCSEDAYRRGTRELRAFAAVDSPYLARVFDAVLEDNFLYAMEYFPLGSLAARSRQQPLESVSEPKAADGYPASDHSPPVPASLAAFLPERIRLQHHFRS